MKSFTERNPFVIGIVAIAIIAAGTAGALLFNSSVLGALQHNYAISAVFSDTSGLRGGDRVTIAGVQVGSVGSIRQAGNAVTVSLKIDHGVVIPADSTAAIKVETILGRKAVAVHTGSDWEHPMHRGAVITKTSSPTEVLDVQTDAQNALHQLDAQSLNLFLHDLAIVTQGKHDQVATIIAGLNRLTGTVDVRRTEVSALIDAANGVSSTLASRDQQLLTAIDNLEVVLHGLAQRRAALTQLLANTDAAASQLSSIVGTNRAKLDALLAQLHGDLAIIGQHQVDLAQGVAYLASAVDGFQSIGYSGPADTPNTWANVYTVGLGPVSPDPTFGCGGALDQALTAALGPDPLSCAQATGPVPTSGSASGMPSARRSADPALVPSGSAQTTAQALNALLVPLLVG